MYEQPSTVDGDLQLSQQWLSQEQCDLSGILPKMDSRNIPSYRSDTDERLRFQIELEFVQCLSNPNYLNFLAQRGYFKEKNFVNYLNYLQYWKRPEYAKYLKHPMCLHLLDLLQYEHFRREISSGQCSKFIEDQILLHWQHYMRKRTRLLQQAANPSIDATQSNQNTNK